MILSVRLIMDIESWLAQQRCETSFMIIARVTPCPSRLHECTRNVYKHVSLNNFVMKNYDDDNNREDIKVLFHLWMSTRMQNLTL